MLIRNAKIVDLNGPNHGKTLDVRIEGGLIAELGEKLKAKEKEEVKDLSGLHISPGFTDLGAYLGDPGFEEREDIASLRAAAAAGGYTSVAVLPNTDPVRQSVADVAYLIRQNGAHPTDLIPLAALSKNLDGKDMTEMLELNDAGAPVFTDGPEHKVSGSLLKRTLEYSKVRDLVVMISPYDEQLVPDGQMHEGEVSTRLGLRGIPAMSETIPLKEAMDILEYTGGVLYVHLLSTEAGVAEVRRAKAQGLSVYATVSAHHLQFTAEELGSFDPNFKMLPPLRGESDRMALIEGLKDGTIDAIVSNHFARHGEEKDLEFSYADFGAIGLQTAFRQALLALKDHLSLEEIVARFSTRPTRLLGPDPLHLRSGAPANLTLFTPDGEEEFLATELKGKTNNSPLLGKTLPGAILGVVNNGVVHWNE
ncbi:dihydroorotase [Neolewinella aurantiaca]|uniref:Dihydroorotase n=1 Tax=Neolewinella aurantiaca TaxID=2602767 RepID=A0A5C7F8U3_9BACT|nr:dihydroorotase [Neolewinella aurantiaca]TXF87082.1 dihydroorotase [Neolewinella aurantiaca]